MIAHSRLFTMLHMLNERAYAGIRWSNLEAHFRKKKPTPTKYPRHHHVTENSASGIMQKWETREEFCGSYLQNPSTLTALLKMRYLLDSFVPQNRRQIK